MKTRPAARPLSRSFASLSLPLLARPLSLSPRLLPPPHLLPAVLSLLFSSPPRRPQVKAQLPLPQNQRPEVVHRLLARLNATVERTLTEMTADAVETFVAFMLLFADTNVRDTHHHQHNTM